LVLGTSGDIDTVVGRFLVKGGDGKDTLTLDDSATSDDVDYIVDPTSVEMDPATPTPFGGVDYDRDDSAGIKLDAYQLEPLRKALILPRCNLFIADDVGLGKTIEAGLIARELLLRKKVKEIVVCCPPSMLLQWQEELESRFGLGSEILDKEYVGRVRSGTAGCSIAHMRSPGGWIEPGQTPEFDEYTVVLRGTLQVETRSETVEVPAGPLVRH
jgi:hypothetical protein